MMNSTQAVDIGRSVRRRLTQLYLLIGGVALLLAWLSAGTGPSTWGLLLQVIIHFNGLWVQQGAKVLGIVILLLVQSLLLLAAWLLLIMIAMREISRLHTMLPRNEELAPVASPPLLEGATAIQPGSVVAITPQSLSLPSHSVQPSQEGQGDPVPRPEVFRKTPSSPAVQVSQNESLKVRDPYEVTDVYEQVGYELKQAPKKRREEGKDPFAVNGNALEMIQQVKPIEEVPPQSKPGQLTREQDQEFVFGNPFEGPLPDVFEHDMDLKRSLAQQDNTDRS